MTTSFRLGAAVLTAPLLSIAFTWGCAQGSSNDASLSADPTYPSDVGRDAAKKQPAARTSNDAEESTADPVDSPDPDPTSDPDPTPDAGSSADAGPLDAGSSADAGPLDAGSSADAGPLDAGSSADAGPLDAGSITIGTKPAQGEVLITEVMFDPSGTEPASEWFELYNTTSSARTLSGLTIVDGAARTHVIGSGVTIGAGAYVVLVRSKAAAMTTLVASTAIVYEYGANLASTSGIQLANGSNGGVALMDGATRIADAKYGGWFGAASGASVQLKTVTPAASGQSTNWCLSASPWTIGSDLGTPGAASDCP